MAEESILIKFYKVEVGTQTRAGNLNIFYSFIAKSDKDQNSVYQFYLKKYKGFTPRVEEITEIAEEDIPKIASNSYSYDSAETKKIKELQAEIEKLKVPQNAFDRFSGEIDRSKLSLETRDALDELKKINQDYQEKKEAIKKVIQARIREKYNQEVDIRGIELEDFTPSTREFKFTVRLDGKILPANNKL